MQTKSSRVLILALCALLAGSGVLLAKGPVVVKNSENRPLHSLSAAGANTPIPYEKMGRGPREIINLHRESTLPETTGPDPVLQESASAIENTGVLRSWEGADNEDNGAAFGFRISPPDTDGDIGPNHFVQMINLVTTIFDKNGNIVPGGGPFGTNAIWAGAGGLCEPFNQGDPVVVYDETNDRWVLTQFAFDNNLTTFAQCVAVSQTGDPTGAYNRYEFDFDSIGFPDYPKHGVTTESVTMIANIFRKRGPNFRFSGTYLGAIDKAAMYAGQSATLVGSNIGSGEFGFLPGDLDDPSGTAGFQSAIFGTAMSNSGSFDIWEIDVNWNNPNAATVSQIDTVSISTFDSTLCGASRGACITQCNGGPALESLSDRLMARLKIRDFGTHKSMVASHTVDVGSGRGGIRWYEFRASSGANDFSLHQESTYGPNDGLNRWVPSIAIDAAGNIGLGYLVSGPSECLGSRVNGQTAAASGTGTLDSGEQTCRVGVTEQTGSARSGDYSSTNVDPVTGTFWHTNEYGQRNDKSVGWGTTVCEFEIVGTPPVCTDNDGDGYGDPASSACPNSGLDCDDSNSAVNPGAAENCSNGIDDDCDGDVDSNDADCQLCIDPGAGQPCTSTTNCCSGVGNCTGGKPSNRVCR